MLELVAGILVTGDFLSKVGVDGSPSREMRRAFLLILPFTSFRLCVVPPPAKFNQGFKIGLYNRAPKWPHREPFGESHSCSSWSTKERCSGLRLWPQLLPSILVWQWIAQGFPSECLLCEIGSVLHDRQSQGHRRSVDLPTRSSTCWWIDACAHLADTCSVSAVFSSLFRHWECSTEQEFTELGAVRSRALTQSVATEAIEACYSFQQVNW